VHPEEVPRELVAPLAYPGPKKHLAA